MAPSNGNRRLLGDLGPRDGVEETRMQISRACNFGGSVLGDPYLESDQPAAAPGYRRRETRAMP